MTYGLPYKGSKNRIAEWVVEQLPEGNRLVDLFCGGCAVTHAAMLADKWQSFHINDLDWRMPTLFVEAVEGKYDDYKAWVDRSTFYKTYIKSPLNAVVWSYGYNKVDYLYSKEIEPLKKAMHHAIMFNDFSLLDDMGLSVDKRKYDDVGINRRRLMLVHDVKEHRPELNTEMQHIEAIARVQQLSGLVNAERCTQSSADYRLFKPQEGDILYCDIPYQNTRNTYGSLFDYDSFFDWAQKQSVPVFISSYRMPKDRFDVMAEIPLRQLSTNMGATDKVYERIFTPKPFGCGVRQLTLFDF